MDNSEIGKTNLDELVDLINFTESVSTKIHGLPDKDEILQTVRSEFSRTGQYNFYIARLIDNGKRLTLVGMSTASSIVKKLEKITGLSATTITIDIEKSDIVRRIVNNSETVLISEKDFLYELFPKSVASVIYRVGNLQNKLNIVTPVRHNETIGIIVVRPNILPDYLVPSVKSLATHISTALDIANKYAIQRKLQDSLEETNQLNAAVFSGVQVGIVLYDDKLNYTMWNPFMEQISGIPARDVIGKNALTMFPHIKEQELDKLLHRALQGETVVSPDTPYFIVKTGNSGWVSCSYSPHINARGDIIGVIGLISETTQRKQTEEKLRLAQFSLDASWISILWISPTGDFIYVNDAACKKLGYTSEEMLTMNVADLDPLYPEEVRQKQWERVKKEKITVFQSQHRTKDGTVFPVEITSNYLQFNDTEYEFAFATDITARKKAEEDLRQSEARYRTIAERSFDVIFVLGMDGTIEYVSPSVENIIDYRPDELLGQHFTIIATDINKTYFSEMFNDILQGKEFKETVLYIKKKNGDPILVEFNAVPISENGNLTGIQGNARDVTERHHLQQEREEHLQKMLAVSRSVIDTLALTVEKRDPYTAGHQRRVAQLAVAIAREMGLPESSIEALSMAGMIHDIGKIYIPSEILSKPGKLSTAEYNMVKVHPQAGYEILKNIEFPWPIAEIVFQHHERLDGSGYPQGLKDKDILPEAKIMIVADVFEAMVSHRPYRPALGREAALNEIAMNKGLLYDEKAVDTCHELIINKGFTFE